MAERKYYFKEPGHYEYEIANNSNKTKIGTIRIKPNAILWKGANQQVFLKVSLEDFIEFMDTTGKQITK